MTTPTSTLSTCVHLAQHYDAIVSHFRMNHPTENLPIVPPGLTDWHHLYIYAHLVRTTKSLPMKYRTMRLPMCAKCHRTTTRIHACCFCTYLGCYQHLHIHEHSSERAHWVSLDLETTELYCHQCNDYVYHAYFSQLQEYSAREAVNRLNRHEEWLFQREDLLSIQMNSTPVALEEVSTSSSTNGNDPGSDNALTLNRSWRYLGLRGMYNLGQTCYLSVVLQAFLANPLLRSYFLSDFHNPNRCQRRRLALESNPKQSLTSSSPSSPSQYCLGCDVDEVFQHCYSGDTLPFGPHKFFISMWAHAPHLASNAQHDAHEYLMAIFDGLHIACSNQTPTISPPASEPQTNCRCIMHTVFSGQLRSDLICSNCQLVSTAIESMFDISLPLDIPPPATSRYMANMYSQQSNNVLPLSQCLSRFTNVEKVDKVLCRRCNSSSEAMKQFSLLTTPLVLVIHLKRFEQTVNNTTKIDRYVSFPLYALDMTPYLHSSLTTPLSPSMKDREARQHDVTYNLFAVIVHRGNLDNGHYLIYVQSNGSWFKIDDKIVQKATEAEVAKQQAYILFYLRHLGA